MNILRRHFISAYHHGWPLVLAAVCIFTMLPQTAFADTSCPSGMSQLDCDALYGNWANWIPDEGMDCSGTTVSTILQGSDAAEKAMNYLTGKGLTPEQAAGIIGNLQIESGMNPSIVQGGGSSSTPVSGVGFGIAQWTTAGRQQGLVELARKEGVEADTLAVQLDYLWQELNNGYKSALDDLKKQTTAADAAVSFMIHYEAPKDHDPNGANAQARSKAAESVLKLYGTSTQASTGDTVSTDSSTNDDGTCSSATGSSEIRVATYNMLVQDRASTHGYGGDNRIAGIADFIAQQNLQIISAQELLKGTQTKLMNDLPDNYRSTRNVGGDSDAVIWDSDVFKQVDFGTYTVPKIGKTRQSVWVKLQSVANSQQELYVFSMHDDLKGNGTTVGAQNALKTLTKLVGSSDTPAILSGDMNSYYPPVTNDGNEAYKVFHASGKLNLAVNMTSNRTGYDCDTIQSGNGGNYDGKQDCGRKPAGHQADQIWITKNSGITVNSWTNVANGTTIKLSDHNPVIVDLTIPGLGTSFGTGKGSFTDNTSITLPGVQQALARAKELSNNKSALFKKICGSSCYQICDHLAAGVWGYIGSGYASAATHWAAMKSSGHAHPGDRNPPVGALLFYDTGSPAGHVAVYLGNNKIMSNDVNGNGGAYIVDASAMETGPWRLTYLGWSDPIFHGTKF